MTDLLSMLFLSSVQFMILYKTRLYCTVLYTLHDMQIIIMTGLYFFLCFQYFSKKRLAQTTFDGSSDRSLVLL